MNMLIKDLTNLERRRVSIMNRRSKGGSVSDFCCIHFSFHGPVLNSLIYILAAF